MKESKVKNIIKYNLKKTIKNKLFIILNVILFIICIVALNYSEIYNKIDKYFNGTVIEVVDSNGILYDKLAQNLSEFQKVEIKKVEKLEYEEDNFENNKIIIQANYTQENILDVKIISAEYTDYDYYDAIKEATKDARNEIFAEDNNISPEKMEQIMQEPDIEIIEINQDDYTLEEYEKILSGVFLIIMIPFTIMLLISESFSKEMIEEKSSKSSEYVLTNITTKEYVNAKIGTITATVILQIIAIIIYCLIGCLLKSFITGESILNVINLGGDIWKIAIVEFILFILYMLVMLIIQVILCSKATGEEESVENVSKLVNMGLMISAMIPCFIVFLDMGEVWFVKNILSWIPLFSTYLIPCNMLLSEVGIFQIILSLLAYLITIAVLMKIAYKKVKNGILDYKPQKKKKTEEFEEEQKEKEKIKQEINKKITKERITRYSMLIGIALIVLLVLSNVLPLLIQPICYGLLDSIMNEENISMISDIISTIICFYITIKIIEIFDNDDETKVKKKPQSKLKCFFMALPIVVIIYLVQVLTMSNISSNNNIEMYENTSYLLIFIRLVIVPAIFEELLCRKAIFNASKKYGVAFAVIISSILFGVIHLNWYQAIFAICLGVVFAIITYNTGSIIPSMILHAMVNGYSFFTSILFTDNPVMITVININIIGLVIIGCVVLIENVIKNRKKIKNGINNLKNVGKEELRQKHRPGYDRNVELFKNYYFILFIIFGVIYFALNQKYITMLM